MHFLICSAAVLSVLRRHRWPVAMPSSGACAGSELGGVTARRDPGLSVRCVEDLHSLCSREFWWWLMK